ncbi:MAG: InlB B-repeat-containing protein, partial [Oscillospiraceae bacterium]|nr:InlB B-repeat-containing protein [Oscillospiraceae bacterium]
MKKYANKRLLAMLVVITMVIGLFPVNVLAASSEGALPTGQEEVSQETAPPAEGNGSADNNGGQTGVSDGGGQQTDAAEGDGQQTDVTDGDGQQTNVTDGDGQQTNVTDDDGQQTNVTDGDGQQTNVTDGDGQQTNVTEDDNEEPPVEEPKDEEQKAVYTYKYIANKGGKVTRGSEKVEEGTRAKGASAAAAEGYRFVSWTIKVNGSEKVVSTGAFLRPAYKGSMIFYANFEPIPEDEEAAVVEETAEPEEEEEDESEVDISEFVSEGDELEAVVDDEDAAVVDEARKAPVTREAVTAIDAKANADAAVDVDAVDGDDTDADAVDADAVDDEGEGEETEEEEPTRAAPITVTFNPTTDPAEPLAPLTIQVEQGETIGSQLPACPTVPGYTTKWVDGEGTEVTADTVVNEPFTAVVAKDKITYTVIFVQEDGSEETRTADIDTGFAINDLPDVAPKTNKIGKWVYPGTTNEFTVGTVIDSDLTVNAYYEQNIFTVTFMVDNAQYEQMTTATGTTIVLPSDPIKAGMTFVGWFTELDGAGTQYTAESTVSEDLTLYAFFAEQVRVSFLVKDDNGNVITSKSQYFIDLTAGDQITTMPDDPFIEGKVFDHWENETNGETVDIGYTVEDSFNAVAVFKPISSYKLTVNYFYKNDSGERVDMPTQIFELVEGDLPYTVTAPGYTIATEVTDEPTYYPSQPTITVDKDDFTLDSETGKYTCVVEDEYVAADANYKVGHYLKALSGSGYELIETVDKVGVKNSKVTPDIKNYTYAEFESRDENVTLTGNANQELKVYYTRRDFTLSYNVGEGDYIDAVTAPYGTQITLPTTATRAGYTFDGWYKDSAFTQAASSPFTLEENTTLYAKWNPAQSEYKIVYMIENANDDGYSYLATVTKTAATGSSITMTAQTAGANGTRPSELDTTNFTFKDSTTETVLADGTTVVTVRYSRNVYTITWEGSGYELGYWGASWVTGRGRATLTAKYGADISTQWTATFNTPHPDWAWNFSTTNNDEKFTSLDIMPSGNKTVYHWYYSTTKTQTLNYWFENYEGTQTKTYNGRTYGLFKAVTVHYNYLYDTDYPDYAGYTKGGWVRSDGARTLTAGTPNGSMTADFYYNALQYPLSFYNYDGTLISTQQVTLNADISSYLSSNVPEAPMEGATWRGWFTDSEHTSPYSGGTKMPTGLVLYGDFQFPTRTVSFDTNGGSANPESQTDEHGFYATKPADPTRDNYTFQGWYTAADETGSPYDWNKPVTEDITLYAHWTQDVISYTVHYYEKDTTTSVMPDKEVSDPAFRPGQEITENAATVAGYVFDKASETIELGFGENTITFYYSTIPSELTYTVNYVLRDHPEIKVAESKTVTVPGTTTNVMEMAKEVDTAYLATQTSDPDILGQNYKPTETSKELQLALEGNVITFEYIPYTTTKITVNYYDMDGRSIHESETTFVEKGDTFTVQNKAPDGFVYHHAYLDGTTTAPQATYQITGNEGNLVINIYYQKKLIIIANNKAKTYDGTALFSDPNNTSDYTVTGIARGDTLTSIEFDGSQTDAGTSATTPKNAVIELGDTNNVAPEEYYSVVYVPGSLTVKPVSVYISISADQWNTHSGGSGPNYYTGQVFNVGFTNPNKQHFNDASGSAYVSITSGQRDLFKAKYGDAIWAALYGTNGTLISEKDAGTYTVTGAQQTAVISRVAVDGQNMMSDPNYSIKIFARDSFLTIEPLPITITTPSAEKVYDGTALTKEEGATLDHSYWTANIGGEWTAADTAGPGSVTLGTGETITFSVTGSQTPVGSSENAYSIDWGENKSSNYKITATLGTLEVTSGELKVTVKDIEKPYNGSEQEGRAFVATVTGTGETIETDNYKVEGLGNGDVLTITYTPAKGKDVGEYTGSFATTFTIVNAEGEDVTGNYKTPTFTPGKLTITKVSITINITGHNDTQPYNGQEQSVTGYDSACDSSLFDSGKVNFSGSATAARTDVGTTDMGLEESQFHYDDNNITAIFNVVDGYMKITPLTDKVTVTITENSGEYTYDGTEKTVTGYTVTSISNNLYKEADFEFSGDATVKGTDAGT